MNEEKTPWEKMMDKNFLGSWDIPKGKTVTLTIKNVEKKEMMNVKANKKESKLTIEFAEEGYKPLVVNATNGKNIQSATESEYIEDWIGKKIDLYVTRVSAFGSMTDAVRVKPTPHVDMIIRCEHCGKEIHAVGKMSALDYAKACKTKLGKVLCVECAKAETTNKAETTKTETAKPVTATATKVTNTADTKKGN